uniref:Transcription factor MYBS1 n=1 Tax=Anthurium amnicola TaxID=1678845 RepID=A0A1D1Z8C7_9ARAE
MWSRMEILCPTAPYLQNSGLFMEQSRNRNGHWTHEENKRFENALAEFDERTTNRWEKVASRLPGKTAEDVKRHYQVLEYDVSHIEAGLMPPGYSSPRFTLDWVNNCTMEGLKQPYVAGSKRPGGRTSDQERKKGVPWTEKEHKLFLEGLSKYGKGDWRNISRKCVITRNPTQVASHAQKYFIRLNAVGKDKRRSSIHDITTANMSDTTPPSPPHPSAICLHSRSAAGPSTPEQFSMIGSNQPDEASGIYKPGLSASHISGNSVTQPCYDTAPNYGLKFEAQYSHPGSLWTTNFAIPM